MTRRDEREHRVSLTKRIFHATDFKRAQAQATYFASTGWQIIKPPLRFACQTPEEMTQAQERLDGMSTLPNQFGLNSR